MRTGKIRNQKLEKRSLGEQGGYIGVWAMCSFILALPGSVAGQFAAVTYQSRKITLNLLGGQKVLIINDPDLGAITTHAQEVIKELPTSLQADVAREVEGKIWEAGEIHARTAELRKIDTRQLTAAQSAELDQTLSDLASAQRELETQIIDLAAKATAAGQLKDANPEAGIKAAKALIERVRRPDPDAIAGPLLETYIESYNGKRNHPEKQHLTLESKN